MGVVYEAWDPALGRAIALKTVGAASLSRSERKAYEKRFLTEARAAARLSHPGIVVVHDVGRDSGHGLLYIALERLEGQTLADRIASGQRLEWREALRIVGRVAEALHHAHTQGVVHRDVKPAKSYPPQASRRSWTSASRGSTALWRRPAAVRDSHHG
jgi:serine/threonine-protein kinase